MCHGTLGDLGEHRVHGLLQGKAQILFRDRHRLFPGRRVGRGEELVGMHLGGELVDSGQDAGETAVHALDGVGQFEEVRALLSQLLDVVARRRVVGDAQRAGEAVETVAHGDVEGLAEDPVPLRRVRDHLRVAAGDVEDHGICGPRDRPPHLDVADAVVDAHDRLVPEQAQRPRGHGDGL